MPKIRVKRENPIPDPMFLKKLKESDPRKNLKWNYKKQYWEIWHKDSRSEYLVVPVIDANNNPHPLDDRVLWWLHLADTYRFKSREEYYDRMQDYADYLEKREGIDEKDNLRHRLMGDWWHLAPHIITPHRWYGEI